MIVSNAKKEKVTLSNEEKKRIILGPLQVDHENVFSLVWIVLASEGGGEEMKSF